MHTLTTPNKAGNRSYAAHFISGHVSPCRRQGGSVLSILGVDGYSKGGFEATLRQLEPGLRIVGVDKDRDACMKAAESLFADWGVDPQDELGEDSELQVHCGRIERLRLPPLCGFFADFSNSFYSETFKRQMHSIIDSLDTRLSHIPGIVVACRNRNGSKVPAFFKDKDDRCLPAHAISWSGTRYRNHLVHWSFEEISTCFYRGRSRKGKKMPTPMAQIAFILHRRPPT